MQRTVQQGFAVGIRLSCSAVILAAVASCAVSETTGAERDPRSSEPQQTEVLNERLATGEFGPALDAAQQIPDSAERSRQLREISAAQTRAGEHRAALATARRIPESRDRVLEAGNVVRDRSRSGGGSMADFTELIELITSNVEPESWEQVGGPGSVREFRTGVHVDPQGLMRQRTRQDSSGAVEGLGRRARIADLNEDLARSTPLRFVSLRRMEHAVRERLESGNSIPETLRRIAGLTKVRYVMALPTDQDIVIAGPAEGWRYDETGRALGLETGRPMLELDDLVVVFRAFAPGGAGVFGCSINTRDENVRQVKEFVEASNRSGPLRPGQLGGWLKELKKRLGFQDVVVDGVPADTRVAQVLVEADYKMKLIGVAKLDGGPGIPSYFDLLRKAGQVRGAPLEALRWWLTMKYDGILHSPDRLTFELQGSSVLVQSENQFVNAQGQHLPSGVAEPVNRQFAENFTRHYAELAQRDPVFSDLQNLFDIALIAAICRQERLHEKADWELGVFAREGAYRPARGTAPKVIESVLNHRTYGGKDIVVQVAGGVQGDVVSIVRDEKMTHQSTDLASLPRRTRLPGGRWWWDAGR